MLNLLEAVGPSLAAEKAGVPLMVPYRAQQGILEQGTSLVNGGKEPKGPADRPRIRR